MSEADVFGKLSRIFETHNFDNDDSGFDEILDDFDPDSSLQLCTATTGKSTKRKIGLSDTERPSPYEVWKKKNEKNYSPTKGSKTLNSQQWDRLVEKMHKSNRSKQSTLVQEQNQGLAQELGGYQFKPYMNQHSLDLSATMKSIHLRLPEMISERKALLERKQRDKLAQEVADCSFVPQQHAAKTSNLYLKRMGRVKPVQPEDLYQYDREKQRRKEVRKQIVREAEEREMTFHPHIGEKSLKIRERLKDQGLLNIDPTTRTTNATVLNHPTASVSADKLKATLSSTSLRASVGDAQHTADSFTTEQLQGLRLEEGPVLVIDSQHPYPHNTLELIPVAIPGAVRYTVRFHEDTRTEAIHDFVRFYADETRTNFYGCNKYSGGALNSPRNWPGTGGRPALVIPAAHFLLCFQTNGSVNDWGFRLLIQPTILVTADEYGAPTPVDPKQLLSLHHSVNSVPKITDAGKNYRSPVGKGKNVHERLHETGLNRQKQLHNQQIDLMQTKLNLNLKPWENVRNPETKEQAHPLIRQHSGTHLPKATMDESVASLMLSPVARDSSPRFAPSYTPSLNYATTGQQQRQAEEAVVVMEFDESLSGLWRDLHGM